MFEVLVKNPGAEISEGLKFKSMTKSGDTDLKINSQGEGI